MNDDISAQIAEARRLGRLDGLREAKDVARLCLNMAVAAAGERAMGARQGARAVHEAIAALIEKETAP